MRSDETLDQSDPQSGKRPSRSVPGLVLVFGAGKPQCAAIQLETGGHLELGRSFIPSLAEDTTVSRVHARVSLDAGTWIVEDLESRNGSRLDDKPLDRQSVPVNAAHVLRLGGALFLLVEDLFPFLDSGLEVRDGRVVGPKLAKSWNAIQRAARSGKAVHLSGETGAGKEVAARLFHEAARPGKTPFIAVNCATLASGIAERLMFGAVRGAYTGAEASAGFAAAAQGGTLFLDEIGDLDLGVQAKLLRLLETHELYPVGGTEARRVDFSLCSASNRDLEQAIKSGAFRSDLYFRIARPAVVLPTLSERLEEIPWLARNAARAVDPNLTLSAGFVEACLLRAWPGNVRELVSEVELAADLALERSETLLLREHLSPPRESSAPELPDAEVRLADDRSAIESALCAHSGNVTAAARALGVHRNQLRRWLTRENIDPKNYST